ncbi:putative serine/threonine-protein kinase PIX13 [Cinnamomum micranthum f. kanehirae]|uniref:non-specific serine/threonine protein kinase n=1 Tax=Cinnamomum micranthum f. kanehirae TaxID=337451 RepID=A0A443NJ34_9MAGN|nr:putative serine/threonine-protein kinase PIX13 [Cinnamomum micranthum f. kanehirae]
MGNFWIAQFDSSSSSSPSSTRPSSPAISRNNSNEGTHSGSTSAFSSSMNEVSPKIFSFAELKKATRKFSRDTFLGEGGFGQVFKGWIDEKTLAQTKAGSGMAIAVKKMNSESLQGREEWQSEVNFLGSFSHPNLVRLLGHCEEDKELLLVYEFMPGGSLENHLFRISGAFPGVSFSSKLCETFGMLLGRQRITTCIMPRGDLESHLFRRCSAFQPLSWSIRLKIAIGVAQGLAFLHTSERPIIYRDVKTSNILLDLNYNAKLADFGLAMSGPYESSYVSTCVVGTYGYAAPEYVAAGHLYVKSDVYGFGVVLLEMLSGLRAFDKNRPSGKQNLVEWAQPYLSDQRKLLSRVMDKRLEGQYPSEGAVQAAQLILKCLVSQPRKRPSMTEVVETLEQIQAIKQMPEETNPVHLADPNYFDHHAQNHSPLHPKSEVNILGSLSHPNIVRLLGHCEEDKELLLVYEFMPGGSLGSHLFSRGSAFQALSWSIRIKIALGVARGLAFLHCSERKIIHRNVTPYNVLIDSNYDAKISDFGLARNGPQGENSHVSPHVMGTYGYVAPEYVATGHQALEPNRPSGQHDLVDWAKPYLSDERKVSQLMDRRLEGQYPSKGAVLAAQLILECLNSDRRKRPSMTEVVEALEQIQAIKHKAYAPRTKN